MPNNPPVARVVNKDADVSDPDVLVGDSVVVKSEDIQMDLHVAEEICERSKYFENGLKPCVPYWEKKEPKP